MERVKVRMTKYPMKLKAPLKDYLWGGTKLKEEYGKETALDKVAESWELAYHKDGMSIIVNGSQKGQTLASFLDAFPESSGENARKFPYFPLLIKLIDARDNLSVQVHPDNDYAMRTEGEFGKTEMWYVVEAEEGASLIYGFKQEISREEFARRIADNTLLEVCNEVPVKKGDVFFIDAGTLHAIGKGLLICEIQQNSNTTYRVYDFGRVGKDGKPRELHVGKAKEVTSLTHPARGTKALCHLPLADAEMNLLAACEYFTVYQGILSEQELSLTAGNDSFQCLTLLSGELTLTAEQAAEEQAVALVKGESVFLPAGLGRYQLKGSGEYILSMV